MNAHRYTCLHTPQVPQMGTWQETQQETHLRGCLPNLSGRDLAVILLAPPEYAPAVLQRCFGSDAAAAAGAKAAWNDYVLRYIDGAPKPRA